MVARIARARFLILAILRSKNTRCRVVGITRSRSPPGLLVSWLARLRNERVDLYGKNGQRKGHATATRGAWTSSRRVAPRLRPWSCLRSRRAHPAASDNPCALPPPAAQHADWRSPLTKGTISHGHAYCLLKQLSKITSERKRTP